MVIGNDTSCGIDEILIKTQVLGGIPDFIH
jgi:hypothetical protein